MQINCWTGFFRFCYILGMSWKAMMLILTANCNIHIDQGKGYQWCVAILEIFSTELEDIEYFVHVCWMDK